jgi:four helix bundle protein
MAVIEAGEQGSRGAGEQGSRGAGEQRGRGAGEKGSRGAGEKGRKGAGEKGDTVLGDDVVKYSEKTTSVWISEPPAAPIVRHEQIEVFALAFSAAGRIFELTKDFPDEERYSLTDQIRKSSRSVCANIAEGWRKRRYKAAFQSSLNVAEAEAAETQTWIRFAEKCGYIEIRTADQLVATYDSIIGKLVVMINDPNPWLIKGGGKRA